MAESDGERDITVKPEEYLEVISTEDERIKIIGEELANDTGRAIFGKISQGISSSNDLSKALEISLPLVNWHINRLLGVGLIKVEKVEMSQKNKEMKYYAPVKTALVIIPPESPDGKNAQPSKKETILRKLRHYIASMASFAAGSSGIYLAEKSHLPQEGSYVPNTAGPMMHAAIKSAPMAAPVPVPQASFYVGEPLVVILALLGGAALFFAVFYGIKFSNKTQNKKSKTATK